MPLVECLSSGKARWPPGSVGNKALGHECRFGPGLAFTPLIGRASASTWRQAVDQVKWTRFSGGIPVDLLIE